MVLLIESSFDTCVWVCVLYVPSKGLLQTSTDRMIGAKNNRDQPILQNLVGHENCAVRSKSVYKYKLRPKYTGQVGKSHNCCMSYMYLMCVCVCASAHIPNHTQISARWIICCDLVDLWNSWFNSFTRCKFYCLRPNHMVVLHSLLYSSICTTC